MIEISLADFSDPQLSEFLEAHLEDMSPTAPEGSRHGLDFSALQDSRVKLWVATIDGTIVGTVALSSISATHTELKSMRTSPLNRGKGIASLLLEHALNDARARNIRRVSLETGSMEFFTAARRLYRNAGFVDCVPFGSYVADPNSVYMTLEVEP